MIELINSIYTIWSQCLEFNQGTRFCRPLHIHSATLTCLVRHNGVETLSRSSKPRIRPLCYCPIILASLQGIEPWLRRLECRVRPLHYRLGVTYILLHCSFYQFIVLRHKVSTISQLHCFPAREPVVRQVQQKYDLVLVVGFEPTPCRI